MLDADDLVQSAMDATGLADFGATGWREGLDRLVDAFNGEADLTEIGDEEVEGPLVIIGLPRTGTTALSNLLAADPQVRSVRLWESSDPVPPPETSTEATDPRIDAARAGLKAMYETFPKMRSLHFQTATGPTECQDLLGMEFR